MTNLRAAIAAEFDKPAPESAQALAAALLRDHGDAIAGILFYGSCRRTGDLSGLLDLTVLHDGPVAFHRRWVQAVANAVLPPSVAMLMADHAGGTVRAKVAVFSLRQFRRRMRAESLDTTVWARFCQPVTLIYARDDGARDAVLSAVARAIGTASLWAVRLGPASGRPGDYWTGLFAHTYAVELRPEPAGRGSGIYEHGAAWFDGILVPGLAMSGVEPNVDGTGLLHPNFDGRWRAAWGVRWVAGKVLNVLRLIKAAFTFEDGAAYVAWKIERHTGIRLELSKWQRRHPLLAAPALLLQLRRLNR